MNRLHIAICLMLLLASDARAERYRAWAISGFRLELEFSVTPSAEDREDAETLVTETYSGLALAGKRGFLGRRHPDFKEKLLEADRERIALHLARNGFPSADSRPEFSANAEDRSVELRLIVDPGPMVRIDELKLSGLPDIDGLQSAADSLAAVFAGGVRFSDALVERTGESLLELFRERGYALVELESSVSRVDSNKVSLGFELHSGLRHRFGVESIEGLKPDLEALAARHLAFLRGADYSPLKLRRAQIDLRELGLFRRIDLRVEPAGEGLLELRAVLEARKSRSTRLAIGTWSDHLWRVRASWRHRNLFRGGRGFLARGAWSPTQREAELSVGWPGLPRPRAHSSLSLSILAEREPSYHQDSAEIELGLAFRPWRPWREQWRVTLGITHVEVDDRSSAQDAFEAGAGELLTLGLDYRLDRSDEPLAPSRGFRLRGDCEFSPPGFLSDYPFVAFEAQASAYRSLGPFVGAMRLGMGLAEPLGEASTLLPAKRLFAGGNSSMRGYRRRELGPRDADGDPLGGRLLALASAELRLPIFGKLGAALFCDTGQVQARREEFGLEQLALAVGPGLSLATPVGPLRADFAFNLDDAPDDWVFHFSIGNPW